MCCCSDVVALQQHANNVAGVRARPCRPLVACDPSAPALYLLSADVHIDHLALAAAIQLQSEGLFRLPPEKLFDTLEVGRQER